MADQTSGRGESQASGDLRDLLPGYALDALDDADRRAVEELLASDAGARRALDEYREVVTAFVVDTEPPAGLRASVLDRVRSTPQETGTGDSPERGSIGEVVDLAARRRPRRWGVALTAVAAAAAIAVPTTIAVQVSAERDRLREQSETVSQMLADPDASILRGTLEGGGVASVLVADGDMFFRAEELPDPGAGKAYQLWVVRPDGGVSSAGVLPLRDGETSVLVRESDGVGMAVSVEPEAGSEQPTTDPVVVLTT